MRADYESYIRARFAGAVVNTDPFPHLVIRDVLPADLYAEMEAAQPSEDEWRDAIRRRVGLAKRLKRKFLGAKFELPAAQIPLSSEDSDFPERSVAWRERFGPYVDLIDNLMHAKFKRQDWRPGQRIFFYRPQGWAIAPHTHSDIELTNSLLYFPSKDNITEQGTFLYRHVGAEQEHYDHSDVEVAAFIPYTRNTLLSWVNTPSSVHGSMETAHSAARRYLYFVGERVA
jgi:hypothetical protein